VSFIVEFNDILTERARIAPKTGSSRAPV